MSEYDHKKSEKIVGQLYPVLVDKRGKVIDGVHRLDSDSEWRIEKRVEIDTEEKFLIARCVANWHRRQVAREEKEEWINGLAEIYKAQLGDASNSVAKIIAEKTGLNERTVSEYLRAEYKRDYPEKRETHTRVSASQAIVSKISDKDYGKRLVERHREEVKAELLKDPKFIMETIEQAPEILPKLPVTKPVVDEEGRHIPTITEEAVQKLRKAERALQRETEERRKDPHVKERGKLVENYFAHGELAHALDRVFCPVCGADGSHLVWSCHPELDVKKALAMLRQQVES